MKQDESDVYYRFQAGSDFGRDLSNKNAGEKNSRRLVVAPDLRRLLFLAWRLWRKIPGELYEAREDCQNPGKKKRNVGA
ncbi:hypothetical protein HY771_03990 [Candidatus Uhrbacteria bacterium]|nr:hypothetical protein [Candidatus Uhrbacteria bacterium]